MNYDYCLCQGCKLQAFSSRQNADVSHKCPQPRTYPGFPYLKATVLGELQKYISVKANVGSPAVLCYKFPIALLKRKEERPME